MAIAAPAPAGRFGRASLWSACGAHIAQDGLVALQYVLLPVLAQTLGLNYAQVGFLRAVSSTALSVLEIPASVLAERFRERRLLAMGLVCAAIGYFAIASATTFTAIALGFLIAGIGAGFQHSLASALLARQFNHQQRRRALGAYNSSGDAGKLAFTAAFSLGVGWGLAWHAVVAALAALTLLFGLVVWIVLKPAEVAQVSQQKHADGAPKVNGWGIKDPHRFAVLNVIVLFDSMVQAVFLTFLAFVLLDKGASSSLAAAGVTIALAGGMAGKLMGGFLAARSGDRFAFITLQVLTLVGLLALIQMPLLGSLIALPAIGIVVQGSSTVTYGAVPECLQPDRVARGYGVIYAQSGIASVVGVMSAGVIADHAGLNVVLMLSAVLIGLTIGLSYVLSSRAD